MPFKPVILNQYLVVIERDGEVIAREAIAAPGEATARLEAGNRHRALLSSARSTEMHVLQLPVARRACDIRYVGDGRA